MPENTEYAVEGVQINEALSATEFAVEGVQINETVAAAGGGDPEGSLIHGKLLNGLLTRGVLIG